MPEPVHAPRRPGGCPECGRGHRHSVMCEAGSCSFAGPHRQGCCNSQGPYKWPPSQGKHINHPLTPIAVGSSQYCRCCANAMLGLSAVRHMVNAICAQACTIDNHVKPPGPALYAETPCLTRHDGCLHNPGKLKASSLPYLLLQDLGCKTPQPARTTSENGLKLCMLLMTECPCRPSSACGPDTLLRPDTLLMYAAAGVSGTCWCLGSLAGMKLSSGSSRPLLLLGAWRFDTSTVSAHMLVHRWLAWNGPSPCSQGATGPPSWFLWQAVSTQSTPAGESGLSSHV